MWEICGVLALMIAPGSTQFLSNESKVGLGGAAWGNFQVVFVSRMLSVDGDAKFMNMEGICRRRK